MKKIGLIVFFLLLLIIPACAQDVIRGHVVDEATGEGIGFASVQYKGINLVTVTDPQGRFTIRLLKGKKLTLKIKGKTYKAKTNKKGKAIFKITKLNKRGKFKAVVKFAGDKCYKKVTKKVKITVKGTLYKTVSKGSKDKATVKKIQKALK